MKLQLKTVKDSDLLNCPVVRIIEKNLLDHKIDLKQVKKISDDSITYSFNIAENTAALSVYSVIENDELCFYVLFESAVLVVTLLEEPSMLSRLAIESSQFLFPVRASSCSTDTAGERVLLLQYRSSANLVSQKLMDGIMSVFANFEFDPLAELQSMH